jgi:hypothetical protein
MQSFFRPFNIVVSVFAKTFPSPEPGHCGLGVVGDQRKCNDMMFTIIFENIMFFLKKNYLKIY